METTALLMMRDIHRHLDEDELENYTSGTGSEENVAAHEEHLLICDACRERVRQAEEYLAAMQFAARKIREDALTPKRSRIWSFPAWIPVFAAAACALLVLLFATRSGSPQPAIAVNLTALRSNGSGISAPAGRGLQLHPDLTGLTAANTYSLEIVDPSGKAVWQGALNSGPDGVLVPAQKAGLYFVRVSLPHGELLREYGLEIK